MAETEERTETQDASQEGKETEEKEFEHEDAETAAEATAAEEDEDEEDEDELTEREKIQERIGELLRKHWLYAWPVVETQDMGIQFSFATDEGVGAGFVADWPLLRFDGIPQGRWEKIRNGIRQKKLSLREIRAAGLDAFVRETREISLGEMKVHEILEGLEDLPETVPDPLYVTFSFNCAEENVPRFYADEDALLRDFANEYIWEVLDWGDLDEDTLLWYEKQMREHEPGMIRRYRH